MFTNNYIELQKAICKGSTYQFVAVGGNTVTTLNNAHYTKWAGLGRWLNIGRCTNLYSGPYQSTETEENFKNSVGGIWFGTGSTPASRDDYKLENVITTNLTITGPSKLAEETFDNGIYKYLSDLRVKNNDINEITISEIGLVTGIWTSTSGGVYNALMERTVLDEPITIPAGESRLITYKLVFNQP